MASEAARRAARQAIERRLVLERAAFLGCLGAFAITLVANLQGAPGSEFLLVAFVGASGLTGAGYDGTREALRDLDLIAGLLDREGVGARIERMPFFMKGHYEIWFQAPTPGGARRFGFSFGGSIMRSDRRTLYVVLVPVPPGRHEKEPVQRRPPYKETGIGGSLEGREIEIGLQPPRGNRTEWRVLVFLRPGRPLDVDGLSYLRRRAEEIAGTISREGVGAVAWGARERFRKPAHDEILPEGVVQLRGGPE